MRLTGGRQGMCLGTATEQDTLPAIQERTVSVRDDVSALPASAGCVWKVAEEARVCASSKKEDAFSRTSCSSTSSLKLRARRSALPFTSSSSRSSSSSRPCASCYII